MHREEEQQESYLASVSDLMSGLLYVFVIAVGIFALDLRVAEERVIEVEAEKQEEIRRLREAETEKQEEIRQLRGADEARAQLLIDLQSTLRERGLAVEIDSEHGTLRLPEEILFRSGWDLFNPGGEERLKTLAEELERLLPCYVAERTVECPGQTLEASLEAVFVEGHTDDQPLAKGAKFRDNWQLSAARAIRTFDVLMAHRPKLGQLSNQRQEPVFGIAGYADSRPVDAASTSEARQRNRRIDLRLLMGVPQKYLDVEGELRDETELP